jgi:hypothetical protein
MKNLKPIPTIPLVLFLSVLLICVLLLSGPIYSNQAISRAWLSQFENGPVTVTFSTAPPGKERIIDARLLAVENSGLVLRMPKDRDKFYPFSNIISVDPK